MLRARRKEMRPVKKTGRVTGDHLNYLLSKAGTTVLQAQRNL
jgi:hypothetical protein